MMEVIEMEWNEETKTLTISWVDLEHIAGDELWRENLIDEMEMRGIKVDLADIEHIVINVQEKVVVVPNPDQKPSDDVESENIKCWLCNGKINEEPTIISVCCETPNGKPCEEKDVPVHFGCYMDIEP